MSIVPTRGGIAPPHGHTGSPWTWTCDGCGDPILSGFVTVRYEDIHAAQHARADWDSKRARRHAGEKFLVLTRSDLASMPEDARWHAWHDGCDPHPTGNDYWFTVSQVPTFEAVLSWTVHLMEKNWFAATDWGPFLRRQLQPRGC